MDQQFRLAQLDGGVMGSANRFAEPCSLLVEERLGILLGSEGLSFLTLSVTSNLMELVNEQPIVFAVAGDLCVDGLTIGKGHLIFNLIHYFFI